MMFVRQQKRYDRQGGSEGRTAMIVLHDLTFAARWADKIIVMKNGALHVHLLDMAIRGVVTSAKKLLHGNGGHP